jgi:hypothetical protein
MEHPLAALQVPISATPAPLLQSAVQALGIGLATVAEEVVIHPAVPLKPLSTVPVVHPMAQPLLLLHRLIFAIPARLPFSAALALGLGPAKVLAEELMLLARPVSIMIL